MCLLLVQLEDKFIKKIVTQEQREEDKGVELAIHAVTIKVTVCKNGTIRDHRPSLSLRGRDTRTSLNGERISPNFELLCPNFESLFHVEFIHLT